MTASNREVAAAGLLRAAVDDYLTPEHTTHSGIERLLDEVLRVATFLAPDDTATLKDELDSEMSAAAAAFLAGWTRVNVGSYLAIPTPDMDAAKDAMVMANSGIRADRAQAIRETTLAERRLK